MAPMLGFDPSGGTSSGVRQNGGCGDGDMIAANRASVEIDRGVVTGEGSEVGADPGSVVEPFSGSRQLGFMSGCSRM